MDTHAIRPPDAFSILEAHYVFLSDADEAEIIQRDVETNDVGMLALRTCRCKARIDGFDEYFEHLRVVLSHST
jgi:hypothetical protein